MKSVGIIGLGRMGRCMLQGLQTGAKNPQFLFTTRHDDTAKKVESELSLTRAASNKKLVEASEVVVIAVKPQNIGEVLDDIAGSVKKDQTIISIVASITIAQIEERLGKGIAVVRAMPNTPAFVGEGMTAFCVGRNAGGRDEERVGEIFKPLGRLLKVDERHMDAVTGLSGCGPAYIYMVIESLTDGGIKVGLPRELATQLAAQTVLGAAKMLLETGRHPAALKDEVTTPAGCTIDGLMELEEGKLRVTLIKAVVQATKRAKALAKQAKL